MCGKSRYCWKTKPRPRFCGARRVTSRPPTTMLPESGSQNPAIIIRVVVLPEPEDPRKVTNSPAAISMETSSTAVTPPYVLRSPVTDKGFPVPASGERVVARGFHVQFRHATTPASAWRRRPGS
jgi:hypothetical protein